MGLIKRNLNLPSLSTKLASDDRKYLEEGLFEKGLQDYPSEGEIEYRQENNSLKLSNSYHEDIEIGSIDVSKRSKPHLVNDVSTSSDYIISPSGSLVENWASVELVPARLIEVNNENVILECITDNETKQFELRSFKRALLQDKVSFKLDQIVLIKIFERPGKFVIEFEEGNNMGFEKMFELDDDIEMINMGSFLK